MVCAPDRKFATSRLITCASASSAYEQGRQSLRPLVSKNSLLMFSDFAPEACTQSRIHISAVFLFVYVFDIQEERMIQRKLRRVL